MLTTTEATQAITESMLVFGTESVALDQAAGRVLQQAVIAERDQPPFDRVTMDGIAIRFASLDSGNRAFSIQGTQHAGDPVQTLQSTQHCIEIMTGAVLPEESDCVIPVERISVRDGAANIDAAYEAFTARHQTIRSDTKSYSPVPLFHPWISRSSRPVA